MSTDFNYIWDTLKTADKILGSYIFLEEKKTIWQIIHSYLWIFSFSFYVILSSYTAYVKQEDLVLLITFSCMAGTFFFGILQNTIVIQNQEKLLNVIQWCLKMHSLKNDQVTKAELLVKIIKFLKRYFISTFFFNTIIITILNYLKTDFIRYRPPLAFSYPVQNHDQWYFFVTSLTIQYSSVLFGCAVGLFYEGLFVVVCITFNVSLQLIINKTEKLEMDINEFENSKKKMKFSQELKIIVAMYNEAAR